MQNINNIFDESIWNNSLLNDALSSSAIEGAFNTSTTVSGNIDSNVDLSGNFIDNNQASNVEQPQIYQDNGNIEPINISQNSDFDDDLDSIEQDIMDELAEEQKIEQENIEEKFDEDNCSDCSICYKKLNIDNIVNTMCGHQFCKKCFFRWMKQGVTCPMCRRNFVSLQKWYENNDIEQEINNNMVLANKLQIESVVLSKQCRQLYKEKKDLMFWNDLNIKRQISLKKQINYTEGFIHGLKDDLLDDSNKFKNESYMNTPWFQGFTKGYWKKNNIEKNIKKRKKKKKKNNLKIDEDMVDEDMIDEDMIDEDMVDENMVDEDMVDEDIYNGNIIVH